MGGILLYLIIEALIIFPAWKIFKRAGMNPALSLLILIPGVGYFIAVGILAFSPWGPPRNV